MNSKLMLIPIGTFNTMLAGILSKKASLQPGKQFDVKLPDGSILSGEIDEAEECIGNVLLVHGLASSAHDPAVRRQATFLASKGFRVFRLNHRNAGSGNGKANGFYHANRSNDIVDALASLASRTNKRLPWVLIGQSLSGNMCLKLAGKPDAAAFAEQVNLKGMIALSPIVDLGASSKSMQKPFFGFFDKMFTKSVKSYLNKVPNLDPEFKVRLRTITTLKQIDSEFIAPLLGLQNADEYYANSSAAPWLDKIELQTRILIAKDDPIAPGTFSLLKKSKNPNIQLHALKFGGHLGFVGFSLPSMKLKFQADEILAKFCVELLQEPKPS